jgi:hypothetical protein
MFQIAQVLGARVVGDDDEEYDAESEMVATGDFSQHDIPPDSQALKRSWWNSGSKVRSMSRQGLCGRVGIAHSS